MRSKSFPTLLKDLPTASEEALECTNKDKKAKNENQIRNVNSDELN